MHLSEAAAITHGTLRGGDCRFDGVAIDSRGIERGDLFVAISGAQRDGHDFVAQAGEHGAVGALVSGADGAPQVAQVAQVEVGDTTIALGELGANWRRRFTQPLLAVTGSNGKTTVSALLAAIFNDAGNCLSPRASFNNQWGVPLTLLRLRAHHTHAVIEMGMNHRGEIEYLSKLARPDIALITNVAPAHLAGLADLQSIADAKAEIFSGLADDGVAVLNADDEFYAHWQTRIGKRKTLSFGTNQDADVVVAECISSANGSAHGSEFSLTIGAQSKQRARICLPMLGQHNVLNAAAAAAAASAAGIELAQIKAGLESFTALNGRLRTRAGINGALLIDDTYNANPASLSAALDVLAGFDGERIAVLGVMAELGAQSDAFHYAIGAHARRVGIDRLLCLAPESSSAMKNYVRGFGEPASTFGELDALLAHLEPLLGSGVTVLIKGSRAAAMERVAAALIATANNAEGDTKC